MSYTAELRHLAFLLTAFALLLPAAAEAALTTHRAAAKATATDYLAPLLTKSAARDAIDNVRLRSAPCRPLGHRAKSCPIGLDGDSLTCHVVFYVRARPRQWLAYLTQMNCDASTRTALRTTSGAGGSSRATPARICWGAAGWTCARC